MKHKTGGTNGRLPINNTLFQAAFHPRGAFDKLGLTNQILNNERVLISLYNAHIHFRNSAHRWSKPAGRTSEDEELDTDFGQLRVKWSKSQQ